MKHYLRLLFSLLVMIFLSFSISANAENIYLNKWPDFQSKIKPGSSKSSVKAQLPNNIEIIEPSEDIPKEIGEFSGFWHGHQGKDRIVDLKLAVSEIKKMGDNYVAQVVYAVASKKAKIKPIHYRLNGKFVNGELQATLPNGNAMIIYRLRSGQYLDAKWIKINKKAWGVGVLTKKSTAN